MFYAFAGILPEEIIVPERIRLPHAAGFPQ